MASVCLLWQPFLSAAGGLIDLHHHVLLLNLEGHMHRNRWWPINLSLPVALERSRPDGPLNLFCLRTCLVLFCSVCGSAVHQQDYLTDGHNFSRSLIQQQKLGSFFCRKVFIVAQLERFTASPWKVGTVRCILHIEEVDAAKRHYGV